MKRTSTISTKSTVRQFFTAKTSALLLVLLTMFFVPNHLFAASECETATPKSSISDSLFQPLPVAITPCSDMLFVVPTETAVTPPNSGGRVLSRDNGASTSYNLRNQSSKYAVGPRYHFLYAIRHGYAFPHNSFERSIDFYVYFLNVLRL